MPKDEKKIIDYRLTRYVCYLISPNGDSRKNVIALEQTSIGLIMDAADNLPYGTRAKWVREAYEKYINAKNQHDSEIRSKNRGEEEEK